MIRGGVFQDHEALRSVRSKSFPGEESRNERLIVSVAVSTTIMMMAA
jgi:hypothetical protein